MASEKVPDAGAPIGEKMSRKEIPYASAERLSKAGSDYPGVVMVEVVKIPGQRSGKKYIASGPRDVLDKLLKDGGAK